MVLNEIRKKDDETVERTRIMIFEEDIYGFFNKFKETFDVMTGSEKKGE